MFGLKRITLALERIERRQNLILDKLNQLNEWPQEKTSELMADEWIQKGIDNIMGFQAGQKRGDAK